MYRIPRESLGKPQRLGTPDPFSDAHFEMSTYNTRVVFDGIAENVFSVSQPVSYAQDFVFAWFEKCLKDIYVDKKCVLGCVSKGS